MKLTKLSRAGSAFLRTTLRTTVADAVALIRPRTGVLFVCRANICRSPMVAGIFGAHAARHRELRLRIESAGTHDSFAGEHPDPRAIAAARTLGVDISRNRARALRPRDFEVFEWIFVMDISTLRDVAERRPENFRGQLGLLMDLVPECGHIEIPDPYYGTADAFQLVGKLATQASEALVLKLSGSTLAQDRSEQSKAGSID